MRVLLFIGLCLFTPIAFGQTGAIKYVRFVHVGERDKPYYNLTVSTRKINTPTANRAAGFEQAIITSGANYADLCKGINQGEYLKMTVRRPKSDKPFYKVEVNGTSFLLDEGNAFTFFRKLTLFMRKIPADAGIAEKLDQINTRIGR